MKTCLKGLLIISLVFISMNIFVDISSGKRYEFLTYSYFKNNLKRLNIAICDYADKNSGSMPSANEWADQLINHNKLILKEDFVRPMSYSLFGIAYNANLEYKNFSDIQKETVVLFVTKAEWNGNGDEELFYKHSKNTKHSYLITLSGEIYRHNPDKDYFTRLSDMKTVGPDSLFWK